MPDDRGELTAYADRGVADMHGVAKRTSLALTIVVAIIAAVLVTGAVVVSMGFFTFVECLNENVDRPSSWPWSPRREFCKEGYGHYTIPLLLAPSVLVTLGAILWRRGRRAVAWVAIALLIPLPFIPPLYIESLDYYLLDEYPILHSPLLRVATETEPPRVCYAYGIWRETPITPDTERTCIDLLPNAEALALTPEYDQGHTPYTLEWVGKRITEDGLPPKTGVEIYRGIVATRWYTLPEPEAELDSTLVD